MSISTPFIRRPVATSLLAAAFLVVGIVCYAQLPVSALPQIDFPTIQVNANLPGASPETMASNVAAPLERQLSQIAGVTEMASTSTLGSTAITLQFDLSRNLDGAAQDVQAAINAAGGQLPTNLPAQPIFRKVNPSDAPIIFLVLSSETLPLTTVSDYADNIIAQQLSRISGVGQVTVNGAQKPSVHIQVDPHKTSSLGIQLDSIRTAIQANSVNAPKGNLVGPHQAFTVYANDQVLDASAWNDLVVGYKNGAPVRVRDIGRAVMDAENNQSGAWVERGLAEPDETLKNGPSIQIAINKMAGANVIDTVNRILAALPKIETAIPPGIDIHVVRNRSVGIRAAVHDIEVTLLITIALVVGVIFLFLRDIRATLVPSVVIPLSLFATAAVMLPAGISLDNLSLMALTIAVGFVVDDAIVMVEAIWRRIEHGERPFQAAINGAGEIGFTVLSISISLVAVFTPLMFMGGVVGRYMQEFALTISTAVLISVLLSLTLTPMLCGKYLKPPRPSSRRFILALERGFKWLELHYARRLDTVMRHKPLTMAVFGLTVALAGILYATASTGFFPEQDTSFLLGSIRTAQGSSYAESDAKAQQVVKVICSDPDIVEAHYNIGGNVTNIFLSVGMRTKEAGRTASPAEVIARLRRKLSRVVGANTVLRVNQDINIGARGSSAQYQYTLSDPDLDELNIWAPRMLRALQKLPELRDVNTDQQSSAPTMTLTINRDAAARFGIAPSDIDSAIYNQIGSREVAQYFTQLNAYHVILEALPDLQATPDLFGSVFINSPLTGKPVPLSLLIKLNSEKVRPLSINHQGQMPAVTLSFNLAPGVALGDATQAVDAAKLASGLPASVAGSFQGAAQAFQQSLSSMPILIIAAMLSVYIILGILYESYIHPLTILSTLPSAGLGALLAIRVAGMDLNVVCIIAIILLIGIVKKNGIMIVDVALTLERETGLSAEAAVIEASHRRLRPILMTTACSIFGGIPMILSSGTGSELRQPLGWAIVGGLLVSQVLTLFSTPVIYVYMDQVRRYFGHAAKQEVSTANI